MSHTLAGDPAVFALVVRIALGALASFFAIIVWTRAASLSWMLVVAGVLANYAGTLYDTLRLFGLLSGPEFLVAGYPLGSLLSENLSILCFIAAFVLYLRRDR